MHQRGKPHAGRFYPKIPARRPNLCVLVRGNHQDDLDPASARSNRGGDRRFHGDEEGGDSRFPLGELYATRLGAGG